MLSSLQASFFCGGQLPITWTNHLALRGLVTELWQVCRPAGRQAAVTVAFLYMMQDGVSTALVLCIPGQGSLPSPACGWWRPGLKDGEVIAANMWGKVKTVLQMQPSSSIISPFPLTGNVLGADCAFVAHWLCWLVAVVATVSGIKYLWDNRSFINTAK